MIPSPAPARWFTGRTLRLAAAVVPAVLVAIAFAPAAHADEAPPPQLEHLLRSIVKIRTFVPPEADSARRLGAEREGNGIVVGDGGLIVTVSYLLLESMSAEIVGDNGRTLSATVIGVDNETGLGFLRAKGVASLPPIPLGDSRALAADTPVVIAGSGGPEKAIPAVVVSRRPFAGSWEYLLDRAIYTAPAYTDWSGAALISADGKLLGVGSLMVRDARRDNERLRGNVFIPSDLLRPILDGVAATGHVTPHPHPWLGLNAINHPGGLLVGRLSDHSPAEAAGVKRGDLVVALAGRPVTDLVDFYRRVWAMGGPGVDVPLTILRDGRDFDVRVRSADRYRFLAKEPTY